MGKYTSLGIGIAVGVIGLVLMIFWWGDFVTILKGSVPLMLVFCGAIALIAGYSELKDDNAAKEKTKADQNTAFEILQDGLKNRGNEDWEGNGICRNFASSVKAVFEAIKANQTDLSRLRDTYCLYEGHEKQFYKPRR